MSVYKVVTRQIAVRDFVKTIYILYDDAILTKVLYNDSCHDGNGEPRGLQEDEREGEIEREREQREAAYCNPSILSFSPHILSRRPNRGL